MNSTPSSRAEFSLAAGGPTHRLGLITPGSPPLARRAALSILLTWVPLLVLSAAQGLAIGHYVHILFLSDFVPYACFLVAIPLLILAEGLIEPHIAGVAAHFIHSRLVPKRQYPAYEAAVDRALRLCDATLAEVVLLGLAGVSVVVACHEFPLHVSTWLSLVSDSVHIRTWAGWWYLVVGMGLFQFLRWR